MKIEDSMVIEKHDLDFFLGRLLSAYLAGHDRVAPKSIVVPRIPTIQGSDQLIPVISGVGRIPVKYIKYVPEENVVEVEEALMEKDK